MVQPRMRARTATTLIKSLILGLALLAGTVYLVAAQKAAAIQADVPPRLPQAASPVALNAGTLSGAGAQNASRDPNAALAAAIPIPPGAARAAMASLAHADSPGVVERSAALAGPELGVSKWNPPGSAQPGGVIAYGIWYQNQGTGIATDTLLVDTLPLSTTYAGDNSGAMTPDMGPNGVITWHVGDLAPGTGHLFVVTLNVGDDVPEGAGALEANCIEISSSAPGDGDPGDDQACGNPVDVWTDEVEMSIDKWPNPGDPTPGQEFTYDIQVCNNRGAMAGPVLITDTLPGEVSVVGWQNDSLWAVGWQEVSAPAGVFALTAAGFPGNFCDTIHLRLLLDAGTPLDLNLSNDIVLDVADDVYPDNNERLNSDAYTKSPRYEIAVGKWFGSGVLVPGGWVRYGIGQWNNGNTPMRGVWLTDTLPVGTSYQADSAQRDDGSPLPPAEVTAEHLVWAMGDEAVATGNNFSFGVDIVGSVPAGTVLTNCVTIGGAVADDHGGDNVVCVAQKVFGPGPNLRVVKEHWWNGTGQLGYRVAFYNVGDEAVSDVWITDTLPTETTWDGGWSTNFDTSRLLSQSLTSDSLAWQFDRLDPGESGNLDFNANLDDPDIPLRWFTNTVQITQPPDDADPTDNTYGDVAFSGGEVSWVDLDVARTRIWACAPTGPFTVTTQEGEWTFPDSCFDQDLGTGFMPGDVVTVTAGAGTHPVVIHVPDPFVAAASSITDTVWGRIDHLDHGEIWLDLWGFPSQATTTDESGSFSAAYPDVPRGAMGDVSYSTEIDYAQVGFHGRFQTPDMAITVNYVHDWVEATYDSGHSVVLTVTNGLGVVKGTAHGTTGLLTWWGGQTGFSTNDNVPWDGQQPDIAPGDWIYGAIDGTYTTSVHVGEITGALDVDANTVTVTVNAPWFSGVLNAQCWIDDVNDSNREFTVDPDGGTYACDFTDVFDLTPNESVSVQYYEPDGDAVRAVFQAPTPHLQIQKWLDNGSVGAGGNAVFYVQYLNQGDADAENVIITDTLQGMTFLTDTLGVPYTGSGSQVTWDLGTVPPGDWIHFYVFAEVTASAGERITNTSEIATSTPFDQGDPSEKYNEWSDDVRSNGTALNVGKWAWTGDPAAGHDVVFSVNVCNNGPTASSEVVLTDTLHPSMTLQLWWGQNPGWVEVNSNAQELVVSRPSVPGGWCGQVFVRATVDAGAWSGMELNNHAVIAAGNDLTGEDDEAWWTGSVNDPHTNLNVDKQFGSGELVPGGELRYNVSVRNQGNVPIGPFRITDTLPVSTTFVGLWENLNDGQQALDPTSVNDGVVVWDLPGLDNGYDRNFEVRLVVDYNATPGSMLVNTAEVPRLPGEDSYDDNTSVWTETLFDHGPNLRVRKNGQWDDWGENTRRASYWLTVENIGDVAVDRVTVTDTYPVGMRLDGSIGGNFWRWWESRDNGDHFTMTLELLEPGWSAGFNFGLITDTEPLPFGMVFTNTAEVMAVGSDTNADDNTDTAVLTTGPDLWVKKDLVGGELRPGELITYSVTFGNETEGGQWWWAMQHNAVLTDTLPTGLEFVSAQQHWCGWTDWCDAIPNEQAGGTLVWDLWPINTGEWNEIVVTVRITDTATGLDSFTNTAEIAGSEPSLDVEPDYDDNANGVTFDIDLPFYEVAKAYASTRIAGMPVTYTLTLTNTGNAAGTAVVLGDKFPTGFTYGDSDGVHVGNSAQWTFATIAPSSKVTGWLSGLLPCTTGSSSNQDYAVISSAEGVTSAVGTPVSILVKAPTLVADFDASATSVVAGTSVQFTDASTTDGTAIETWAWAFGDGGTSSALDPSHAYSSPGTYTAMLTITDTCGFVDSASVLITVTPNCVPLTGVDFAYAPSKPHINDVVTFTATTVPLAATGPITYAWTFGDGGVSSVTTPSVQHTYLISGTKSVQVVARNPCTPAGVQRQHPVTINPYRVFLPLTLRH